MSITTTSSGSSAPPSAALSFWSFLLLLLKCAVCPACLSLFGAVFAGARLGLLGDERFHGSIVAVALVADFFILRAAMRHHRNRWPLVLCVSGGTLALLGHFVAEAVEYAGFALLMLAAVQNVVLLRRHRSSGGSCCADEHHLRMQLQHRPLEHACESKRAETAFSSKWFRAPAEPHSHEESIHDINVR